MQSIHRIQEQWKSARVTRLNETRSLLAEFSLTLPEQVSTPRLREAAEKTPPLLQPTLGALIDGIDALAARLEQVDKVLKASARTSLTKRLRNIDSSPQHCPL